MSGRLAGEAEEGSEIIGCETKEEVNGRRIKCDKMEEMRPWKAIQRR